ncbi:MAG: HlyD family secretion protein [Syntrophobacteraceae bacterium]|nr:HlyD family secretion protein [Syntrophobacteraceae bacterium]
MANEQPKESKNAGFGGRARQIKLGAVVVGALVIVTALYWWFFIRNYATTDDAYAKADSAMIGSRVPGTVLKVFVHNDFAVRTGQPLLELDPADYKVAAQRAKASLDEATADLKAAQVMVPPVNIATSSNVTAAQAELSGSMDAVTQTSHSIDQLKQARVAAAAELAQAARDRKRFAALSAKGAGTQRRQEEAQTAFDTARARVSGLDAQIAAQKSALAAASQQVARLRAQLQGVKSKRSDVAVQLHKVEGLQAKCERLKAELEAARLQLSYCRISAPIDGYVAEKSVQVGDRIQPGQALMAVVPLKKIYVEANFKETQLTDVRVGQPATIDSDLYPNHTFKGRVAGIRAGTGAAFSLIPPENATGNWIKVVQRIPVRIELDQPPPLRFPLRVGASLEVSVNIKNKNGPPLLHSTWTETSSQSKP